MAKNKRSPSSPAIPEEFFEHTTVVLLLNSGVDDATDALASAYQNSSVERDIGAAKIRFTGVCAFIAQPRGSNWSMIIQTPGYLNRGLFSPKAGRHLSKKSKCLAMLILSEDCSGAMDYEIFADGKSVERFASEDLIFRSEIGRELSPSQLAKVDPYHWINTVLEDVNASVLHVCPTSTETHCQLLVERIEDWVKINAVILTGKDLPTENFTAE